MVGSLRKLTRRVRLGLFLLAVLLGVLVLFAPGILTWPPIRDALLQQKVRDLQGSFTVGQVSVGWLSPLMLHEVELRDQAGQRIAFCPTIEGNKNLWRLLLQSSDLGHFHCDRPSLILRRSQGKLNVEEVFAAWLAPDKQAADRPALTVDVSNAEVSYRDDDLKLDLAAQNVQARMSVPGERTTPIDVQINGRLHYDLEKIAVLLRPGFGDRLRISGRDPRPFQLEAHLARRSALQSLRGEATVAVASADLYGFRLNPIDVQAHLADGWVRGRPIEAPLSGGQLRLEPSLRLDSAELFVAPGRLLDRVRLTPAMCDGTLAYVAPILARALDVDGQISLTTDGGRLPLTNPRTFRTQGSLRIHNIRASGSPFLRELGLLLGVTPYVQLVRETDVAFAVLDGRVHHQNLELVVGELTVRTSGSVGLDGSLSILAEMPILPRWVGSGRMTPTLLKQTIRVPITGTLEQPRIDRQTFQTVLRQSIRGVADDWLRRELDKIFK